MPPSIAANKEGHGYEPHSDARSIPSTFRLFNINNEDLKERAVEGCLPAGCTGDHFVTRNNQKSQTQSFDSRVHNGQNGKAALSNYDNGYDFGSRASS